MRLWRGTKILDKYEGGVNKRSAWYSENPQYRNPKLTYRQTMHAFRGLISVRMIEETTAGHFNHETLESEITRFVATDELLSLLSDINEDLFLAVKPDLESQCIIM
jgi:hypothetical protein